MLIVEAASVKKYRPRIKRGRDMIPSKIAVIDR